MPSPRQRLLLILPLLRVVAYFSHFAHFAILPIYDTAAPRVSAYFAASEGRCFFQKFCRYTEGPFAHFAKLLRKSD